MILCLLWLFWVLAAFSFFPALDAFSRLVRLLRFREIPKTPLGPPGRLLALIPARAEGTRLLTLCQDLKAAASLAPERDLQIVVVLDGPDPEVEPVLRAEGGVEVILKTPPGPSKGAVLSLASEKLGRRLDEADFILVLDADMRLPREWLRDLLVPAGAQAFQAPVKPMGTPTSGADRVASLSLAVASRVEDPIRDACGLPVRLRGKAMGFTPRAWRLGPAVSTKTLVEDSEATLRLESRGVRVRALSHPVAFEEPASGRRFLAASRARWFAGHLKLAITGAGDVARLAERSPWAAFVLSADLFLRPRAFVLSFLASVAAGSALALVLSGLLTSPVSCLSCLVCFVVSGTALVSEFLYYRRARALLSDPEIPPLRLRDFVSMLRVSVEAAVLGLARPGRWHRARP